MERKGFRKCSANGYFGDWVTLSEEEGQVIDNCMHECVPGQYACNLRDHDYRVCQENGKWWPPGSGWARIPSDADNSAQAQQIRQGCAADNDQYYEPGRCYPGQYRCFNDGGYNICGDRGTWSESGTTSRDFGSFLNLCAFPRNR